MAIDPSIPLQARSPNLMQALMSGYQAGQAIAQAPLMRALMQQKVMSGQQGIEGESLRQAAMRQQMQQSESQAGRAREEYMRAQQIQKARFTNKLAQQLQSVPFESRQQIIEQSTPALEVFGIDKSRLDPTDENLSRVISATAPFTETQPDTADTKEFKMLTEGLAPEEIEQAKKVRLGIEARAQSGAARTVDIGGVPHVFDPNTRMFMRAEIGGQEVTPESIGEAEAVIASRKETGKRQAEISSKLVDKSFERIGRINKNIGNIDKAISALDRGAKTGAIQRLLPSVTAASKELEQIQNELGLDVIGDVTFGALSQGELDLALQTALPTGLNENELKDFLQRKRSAQIQLRSSLEEAVKFLSKPGATVADYIDSKKQAPKRLRFNPDTGKLE